MVAPELPVPSTIPPLPGTGDPIDDRLDPFLGPSPFTVHPGGASLVAPSLLIPFCNSGLLALLRMPLDPESTIRYFDDADDGDDLDTTGTTSGTTDDGVRWNSGVLGTAGGYHLGVTAVERSDGGSDVVVDECGD